MTGRLAALPAIGGGGHVAERQLVLRWEPSGDFKHARGVRSQQDRLTFQRRGDVADRRPDGVVKACRDGHATAEVVKLVGAVNDGALRIDTFAQTRGQIAGDDRRHHEKTERDNVGLLDDAEGIARRGEEEVVGEKGQPGGGECGPTPETRCHHDNACHEDHRQACHRKSRLCGHAKRCRRGNAEDGCNIPLWLGSGREAQFGGRLWFVRLGIRLF
ncbi:hypothetical protein GALL_484700 [mine drainage metagenome]|uniref:Uncharacterized protein n=1 Tax=mine drainage metagenome TaxID=410659 RepID=A0A1J5PQS7_9ZZZZ